MNTLHYFAITVLLIFSSIQSNAQESCECFKNNYSITPQGAFFWQAAWFNYYGINPEVDRSANQMSFSGDHISYFMDSLETGKPQGFRMYYGLKSLNDTVPILVMVPISGDCNDVLSIDGDKQVLVSTGTSDYFCSADSAAVFTGNWQVYNTINTKIETYINAYNYDATVFSHLLKPNYDGESGLRFEFGLRTLSPQEVCFDAPSGNYGSIIYCNLIYNMDASTEDAEDRMDFAMPCPKLCDSNGSPLNVE